MPKKVVDAGHLARAQERVGPGVGKTLAQLQAERLAAGMFADYLAGAGVGYNQIAKEVLFFLPKDFLAVYEELWYEGLAGKDDGGTGARGRSQAETGALGKAPTRNQPGKIQISGGGAKRKSYKKYWVIADEEALAIKDRVDKRLRGLAREVREDLEQLRVLRSEGRLGESRGVGDPETAEVQDRADGSAGEGGAANGTKVARTGARAACNGCGRLIGSSWKFCSNCGRRVDSHD